MKRLLWLLLAVLVAMPFALAQTHSGGGGGSGGGSGTVTSATVAGTTNQITVTGVGSCASTTVLNCKLSLPNGVDLGTDNSAAGTLQLANGSSNAHTIFGSAATTSNTILGFATAPTTGHLVGCTVSSTTCILVDAGAPGAKTDLSNLTGFSNGILKVVSNMATAIDFPDVKIIPAANCVFSAPASSWNTALTPGCINGTNNFGGYLPFIDTSTAQFEYELPGDWDTTAQPYVKVSFQSNTNTSGTVIFTAAVACYKSDGSVTSDPAFNTADALATKTMATATRGWDTSVQLTQVTSGNNCVPGGTMLVNIARTTDTASAAVWVTKAVITTPRLIVVQAN